MIQYLIIQDHLVMSPSTVHLCLIAKDCKSKFGRVLTIVYNTQNYWLLILCPPSGILETRKHNVSETNPFSEM
jgi:hypothetical protein